MIIINKRIFQKVKYNCEEESYVGQVIKHLWSLLCVKATNKQRDKVDMACILAILSTMGSFNIMYILY